MTRPTDRQTTWVLRRLGTDHRGRVGFIINPDADPAELVAALREAADELRARRTTDGEGDEEDEEPAPRRSERSSPRTPPRRSSAPGRRRRSIPAHRPP